MGFFEKLKNGLAKTKAALSDGINNIFKNFRRVDEDLMDELEELLITSDVGVETTMEILDTLRDRIKTDNIKDPEQVKKILFDIIRSMIGESEPIKTGDAMTVILVIGVNGVGKTTSIAKIANVMKRDGKKVILCAADTFRAAAADQLRVWADRVGVDLIAQSEGSDPAAVVYDAAGAAKKRGADVLIIDTAGRLAESLNDVGIVNDNGRLRVNESRLAEALNRNSADVANALGQNGLAGRLDRSVELANSQRDNLFPSVADYLNDRRNEPTESLYAAQLNQTAALARVQGANFVNMFT